MSYTGILKDGPTFCAISSMGINHHDMLFSCQHTEVYVLGNMALVSDHFTPLLNQT